MTKTPLVERSKKKNRGTALIFVLICLLVLCFAITENRDSVMEFLFPGGSLTARSALTAFGEDIRNGESAGEAFTAFCREIVGSAEQAE